ncbi:copper resistance CopC family protein [Actinoplanes regularis]|uniref:CopC domain-containing protein n=1 Tax=Actinoplanes regularis TaxID=52697 RepID=A0A238ZWV9_9ACTN|nr:copper resistance CopC family protein [Actinoplanes regularis]GIE90194.1 hypothetical protein Are01nite_66740 [Actinoplanes regularis]SNR87855.1 hypothetical protein SAMN06264365_106375 [Actinoplanes regularis]
MKKRLLLALATVLAVLVPAAPAAAHNPLVEAVPAKNATVKKAPESVTLTFLEKLNTGTKIAVTNADGAAVGGSEPKVSGKTVSVTFGEPLTNGKYTVAYQITAADGDVVKSSYTFTVAAPEASPTRSEVPVAEVSATAASPVAIATTRQASAESDSDSGGPWLGLAAGIGILVLAGAAVFVFIRRRNTSA